MIFFSSSMQGLLVVAFGIKFPDRDVTGAACIGSRSQPWTPKVFFTHNCLLHTSVVQCMMGKIKIVLVLLELCHGARRSVRKCDLQTSRSFVIRAPSRNSRYLLDSYSETTCESSKDKYFLAWSQSQ